MSQALNVKDRKLLQITVFIKNLNRRWDVRLFKTVSSTTIRN